MVPGEKDPLITLDRMSGKLDLGITKNHVDLCHYLPTRNPAAQPCFVVLLFLHKHRENAVIQKIRSDQPKAELFGGSPDAKNFCQRPTYPKNE